MKFVAIEEISAPADHVWPRVSDLNGFEARFDGHVRDLRRRPPGPADLSTVWTGEASVMGKRRRVEVRLTEHDAPRCLETLATTDGMLVTIRADLHVLAPQRTRLTVTAEARARSLAARLLLQSVRLGRKTIAHRFKERVAQFAEAVEGSYVP